jgi:hypothetical protein
MLIIAAFEVNAVIKIYELSFILNCHFLLSKILAFLSQAILSVIIHSNSIIASEYHSMSF